VSSRVREAEGIKTGGKDREQGDILLIITKKMEY